MKTLKIIVLIVCYSSMLYCDQLPRVTVKKSMDMVAQSNVQPKIATRLDTVNQGAKAKLALGKSEITSVGKQVNAKNVSSRISVSSVPGGVIFKGVTENGVTKNTFLCGKEGVGDVPSGGANFEAGDCSFSMIQDAVGFDISQGGTLQFFNNFTYWLRKKGERKQFLKINYPDLKGASLTNKMNSEGWGFVGAQCILISTNPVLQKVVAPQMQPKGNEVKVIAQLWYNGDNMLQLWSQDVVMVPKGKSFSVAISNAQDNSAIFDQSTSDQAVEKVLQNSQRVNSTPLRRRKKTKGKSTAHVPSNSLETYASVVTKQMQPSNRNSHSYDQSVDSPRSIKINIMN